MNEELLKYLAGNGKTPVDYILSKFEDHDIVLLGEMHIVKQQLEIYHQLIPELPEKGITAIAYEFARREDQALVDELISKPCFDIPLVKEIMIKQEALWGFQEYLEIFRLVWSVNRALPEADKIKIIALNDPINWPLYNSICNTENRKPNEEEIKKIWEGCAEKYWEQAVTEHLALNKGKILGIMGSHHAFTRYREPEWKLEGEEKVFAGFKMIRFGNHLHERYGERLFNICFCDPWESRTARKLISPAYGLIEKLISPLYSQIGFDLKDSPWGELKDDSIYALGYPDFRLKQYFDGMIYTGKISELQPVSPIAGFIDEDNIALFRDFAAFNMEADKSIEEINAIIHEDAALYE